MKNPRLNPGAPVIVQGITGRQGQRHTKLMREFGTNVVGGVSPNASVKEVDGLPVFTTVAEAVAATGAVGSVVLVRPDLAAEAVIEATQGGIRVVSCVTEGIPIHDTLRALRLVRETDAVWIGCSSPGMAIPGAGVKLGFLPNVALRPGNIGIMSKSGTLSYEVGYRMVQQGLGQSVWCGVGGDPVKGTRFAELVPFYKQDVETEALAIVGEIGGNEEEDLAEALIEHQFDKPVFALIAGGNAPEGITMGHAGALIFGTAGTAESKRKALEGAGAHVFRSIDAMVRAIAAR